MTRRAAVLVLALVAACGRSAADLPALEATLVDDPVAVTAAVDEILDAGGLDGETLWRLEDLRCRAYADAGRVQHLVQELVRLHEVFPERVDARYTLGLAERVELTGDFNGAFDVVQFGRHVHPGDHDVYDELRERVAWRRVRELEEQIWRSRIHDSY